jgi:hypothetical protein
VLTTPVANLPMVSTTQAELVAKFAAGVVDTGGKFATVVVDTGGAPWLAIIFSNFKKIWHDPNVIFRGLGGGEVIHQKTWSKKSRDTVPLSMTYGKCLNVWVIGVKHKSFWLNVTKYIRSN